MSYNLIRISYSYKTKLATGKIINTFASEQDASAAKREEELNNGYCFTYVIEKVVASGVNLETEISNSMRVR